MRLCCQIRIQLLAREQTAECLPSSVFLQLGCSPKPVCLSSLMGPYLTLLLLLFSLCAQGTPLSYQQMATVQVNGGYATDHAFFLNQRGLLTRGPQQLDYHVQCQSSRCVWQHFTVNYRPAPVSIDIGYNRRFQSHVLARRQPFFGLTATSTPHHLQPRPATRWRPWLGLLIPKRGLVSVSDTLGTLQQSVLASGHHTLMSDELPTGRYTAAVQTDSTDGDHDSHDQFVVNDVTLQARSASTLSIGFPTNQAASGTYGLPPIDTYAHRLLLNFSHQRVHRLGTTQSTMNLQGQQLSLGLNHRLSVHQAVIQPEVLWQHALNGTNQPNQLAVGALAQGLIGAKGQWQVLSTTYPKHRTADLPWVLHSQLQWLHQDWMANIATHFTETTSKNALQTVIKHQQAYSTLKRTVILSSRWHAQKPPDFSVGLTLRQRKTPAVDWQARATADQQSVATTYRPKPNHRVQAAVVNQARQGQQQQRLAVDGQWRDHFAYWRATSTVPRQGQSMTWSLQAKTGLICTGSCAIWTPIRSVETPYEVWFDPNAPRRFFYWGLPAQLQQQGLYMRSQRAYRPQSSVPAETLYPSNVLVSPPMPS
jgi:hypothetical protein